MDSICHKFWEFGLRRSDATVSGCNHRQSLQGPSEELQERDVERFLGNCTELGSSMALRSALSIVSGRVHLYTNTTPMKMTLKLLWLSVCPVVAFKSSFCQSLQLGTENSQISLDEGLYES